VIRRAAALLGMLAFGLAWVVGVWFGRSPRARLESAALALCAGCVAGAAIGIALQKVVLARIAEKWDGNEPAAGSAVASARKPGAAAAAPVTVPASVPASVPAPVPVKVEAAR